MCRNPSVLPRAFIAGKYRLVTGQDAAKAVLLTDDFEPGREVILYDRPANEPHETQGLSSATVEHYRTNEVIIRVSAEADGLLVLSDTYYPGWKAEIDGVETSILQANLCQRAVAVPAGEHSVRFVFDSWTIKLGFVLSVSCCVAVVVVMAWRKTEPSSIRVSKN
jgi:hypothetical protein